MTSFKILTVSLLTAFNAFLPQQYHSKMLLGEWKVTTLKFDYPAGMSATEKMKADMDLSKSAERFKSSPFIFGKDSVLSVMGKDGQWALEKDGLHIRFILMKNEELVASIISLNAAELQFSVMDHDTKEYFILKKIK